MISVDGGGGVAHKNHVCMHVLISVPYFVYVDTRAFIVHAVCIINITRFAGEKQETKTWFSCARESILTSYT